jgi:hypothetical protein
VSGTQARDYPLLVLGSLDTFEELWNSRPAPTTMTLAGIMVRDWGITNNKEMDWRMEKKEKWRYEQRTRAKGV